MSRIEFEVNPDAFRCRVIGWIETDDEKRNWRHLIL